jgi:large subunit ribosomal protein L24
MKTKNPKKQRKRIYQAAHHKRSLLISAHLSSELRKSYNFRSIPIKTGDRVKIYRGDYKGYEGRVLRVNKRKYQIFIDGINREKADGTSISVPIHPSKVEVIQLSLDDKWRNKIIERKSTGKENLKPLLDEVKNKEGK